MQVFGDREIGNEGEMLVNGSDPVRDRFGRRGESDRLATDIDLAAVGHGRDRRAG